MKQFLIIFFLACSLITKGQPNPENAAIERACLDYVQGFYTADTVRVSRGVHRELAKRIVMRKYDDKLNNMSAAQLIKAASGFKDPADPNPSEPFKGQVQIFDIDKDNATAKITTNKMKFFDYVHLAKIKGEWKVINVLWAFN